MKLRALALLLVLANLAFFIWSQGWLDGLIGSRALGEREPERMARQVEPQLLRVLPGAQGAAAMAGPTIASLCLEAGPFTPAEAEAALAAWHERGVRSARSVPREASSDSVMLRIDDADAALAQRLALDAAPLGKPFAPCAR